MREFLFLVYFERGRAALGICDFASSLTVHLLLLIAEIGLLFYLVYKSKEHHGAGSCVASVALCHSQKHGNKLGCYLLFIVSHDVKSR